MSLALTQAEGAVLVTLARSAVEAGVRGQPAPRPPVSDLLSRRVGAFITLHRHGELRGCIGQPEPRDSLGAVIVHCAVAAALEDPRFPPVRPDELPAIAIEVSVLTTPRATAPEAIEIGRHGLVITRAGRRGLLLPQVAVEWGWTREEFLAHACRKAGLSPDAWREGAQILAFEAEIFSESSHDA